MTITVGFSVQPTLSTDILAGIGNADVTALAGGGIAAVADTATNVRLEILSASGVSTAGVNLVGSDGAVAELSTGNLVVTTDTTAGISYTVLSATGASLLAQTTIGNATAGRADVVATAAGRLCHRERRRHRRLARGRVAAVRCGGHPDRRDDQRHQRPRL